MLRAYEEIIISAKLKDYLFCDVNLYCTTSDYTREVKLTA
jgi:hypothetical protein